MRLDVVIDLGDGTMLALYVSFPSSAKRCIKRVISEHLERLERSQWENHDLSDNTLPTQPSDTIRISYMQGRIHAVDGIGGHVGACFSEWSI